MRNGADQTSGCTVRKLGVRIERDDVAYLRQHQWIGSINDKARIAGAAQEMIKLPEFASFSLPADPTSFSLIPLAATMKEIKARRLIISRISGIQVQLFRRALPPARVHLLAFFRSAHQRNPSAAQRRYARPD